ncbi:hypothetical protein Pmani_010097 [Petrolisthes manimaculis]|uniref:Fucosyltransferase n=1 Tax=Petrolisthes manimaculis TaxID=1843537 RepID=A0AAE1Q5A2_9EUCA|nr:hypothetical protein Pmani_010097 [Petrolisthes manimaculis]
MYLTLQEACTYLTLQEACTSPCKKPVPTSPCKKPVPTSPCKKPVPHLARSLYLPHLARSLYLTLQEACTYLTLQEACTSPCKKQQTLMHPGIIASFFRRKWLTITLLIFGFRSGENVPTVVVYVTGVQAVNGWYINHMKDIVDGKCPLPCKVTKDLTQVKKADAVLIHIRSLSTPTDVLKKLGPRDPSQPWVMLEMETELLANSVHHTKYSTLDNFFNRTMYYRQDADIRLLHVTQDNFNSRKLAVAFISHCKDSAGRLTYVWELQKHMKVHLYGRCGNLTCGKSLYVDHNYHIEDEKCLKMAGNNYLFFLAFENALCEDYVKEKLYNLLFYPIVPVVMVAADYSTLMPPHSYINALQYTPQQLALKLTHLAKHPQEYAKYLEWRKYYQPSTVGGNRVFCDLCVRLHQPDFYKHNVIENFREWFVVRSNCNRNDTVVHWLRH